MRLPIRMLPLVLAAAALSLLGARADALEVPRFDGYVTDRAGAIHREARGWLESNLRTLELGGGVQMAVLVVRDLQGTTVEDFAQQVFDAWKIGDAKEDKGLLLLVSTGDRKMRLQVGYGLEGTLPDGKVGAILDQHVVPAFRAGDVGIGIVNGVRAVMGEMGVQPTEGRVLPSRAPRERGNPLVAMAIILFLVGLATVSPFWRWVLLNMLLNATLHGPGRSGSFGGGSGFGGFGGGSSGGGGASRGW